MGSGVNCKQTRKGVVSHPHSAHWSGNVYRPRDAVAMAPALTDEARDCVADVTGEGLVQAASIVDQSDADRCVCMCVCVCQYI